MVRAEALRDRLSATDLAGLFVVAIIAVIAIVITQFAHGRTAAFLPLLLVLAIPLKIMMSRRRRKEENWGSRHDGTMLYPTWGRLTPMPGDRAVPSSPSLRPLRLEAKRCQAAGHIDRNRATATVSGTAPGASTSLVVRVADGETLVAPVTPRAPIAAINEEVR